MEAKGNKTTEVSGMIASIYIKNGKINLYNESLSCSNLGGIEYELGRPLLDFVCADPAKVDEHFFAVAETFNNELAHEGATDPAFIESLREVMGEFQRREVYLFFYGQIFMEFIYAFIKSPQEAVKQLTQKIPMPNSEHRLAWALDFKWPASSDFVKVPYFQDTQKRLYQAAIDAAIIIGEDIRKRLEATIFEIDWLIYTRNAIGQQQTTTEQSRTAAQQPKIPSLYYLYLMEESRKKQEGHYFFLEHPFRTFYGIAGEEIVQLYEIHSLNDLFRYEFIKMIEHDVFIKKCKNCGHFFIPRGRPDAEYCRRTYANSGKRCNEIGAMTQYERRVAENPILEMHKKAYRRFNSRTRTGKMTQAEFLAWSEEASRKRNECMAGFLPVDEFKAWLEQGRVRRARSKPVNHQTYE